MTKREIIERLYVLRSALSVISSRVDLIKENEDKVEKLQKEKETLPSCIASLKEELVKNKSYFKRSKRDFISSVGKLVFFILVVIFSLMCVEYAKSVINLELNFLEAYVLPILFGFLVIISIPDVIKKYKYYKKNKDDYDNMICRINEDQDYLKSLDLTIPYQIGKLHELERLSLPVVEYYYNAAKQLFEFTGFLHEQAWQYVDLLLYAFEVMQKDTMKEALEYVQMQVNHDELVRSINAASRRISTTIENSVAVLRSDMNNYYNQLSSQIADGMKGISKDIDNLNAEFKKGNVLMNKIETNSKTLMDDLKYVKVKYGI